MSAVQVIALIVAVGLLYQTFIHFRREALGLLSALAWAVVWLGLAAVVIFPGFFRGYLAVFQVARLLDVVIIVGILILAIASYQNFVMTRKLWRTIDRLARSIAITELESEQDQHS